MPIRNPCGICAKIVAKNHRAINCDICNYWVHAKCNHINKTAYESLMNDQKTWSCIKCVNNSLPFLDCSDETIKEGNFSNSENIYLTKKKLNIFKEIDGLNLHNEFDPILDNCLYYDLDELNKIPKENGNLSLLHLNIASLALHFDELHTLLATSNNKFDIMTETGQGLKKIKHQCKTFKLKGILTQTAPLNQTKAVSGSIFQKNLTIK